MYRSLILIGLQFLISACALETDTNRETAKDVLSAVSYPSDPGDDAPELAHRGNFSVGVTTLRLLNSDQPDIANINHVTGDIPRHNRQISVDLFYPATLKEGDPQEAQYTGRFFVNPEHPVPGLPETYTIAGKAQRDATGILDTMPFPLVIVSHGFASSAAMMSSLSENIASKGYVVAVIEHADITREDETALITNIPRGLFIRTFPRAMLFRPIDQRFVYAELERLSKVENKSLPVAIDFDSVALVGYSMGGYGALNVAGAGFSKTSEAYHWTPAGQLEPLTEGHARHTALHIPNLKAVVAFAPWGAQAPARLWRPESVATIKTPTLFVVGSEDDVSGYKDGVKWLFDRAIGTERHMLVYQNALHNIVQNPAPEIASLDVSIWENFEDPTWRRDKINTVNQHFVSGFLDWRLKGDESRAAYFDLPTIRSNDGKWPHEGADFAGDRYANGDEASADYWRGFKRRQAFGLEMYRLKAGESGVKSPSPIDGTN